MYTSSNGGVFAWGYVGIIRSVSGVVAPARTYRGASCNRCTEIIRFTARRSSLLLILFLLIACEEATHASADEVAVTNTTVRCHTTQGNLDILVRYDWAPIGADRFIALVERCDFVVTYYDPRSPHHPQVPEGNSLRV